MKKNFSKLVLACLTASVGISCASFLSNSKAIETPTVVKADGWKTFGKVNGVIGLICDVIGFGVEIYTIVKSETDNTQQLLEQLIETVGVINEKVTVINDKMNLLLGTLPSEFGQIKVEFSEMKVRDDLSIVSNFDTTGYTNYIDDLDLFVNRKFIDFSNPSKYEYPETYTFDQSYVIETGPGNGNVITIKGEDVKNAILASSSLSIDTKGTWFEEVADRLYDKYVADQDLFISSGLSEVLSVRRDFGFSDDSFKKAFSHGFYEYIYKDFVRKIINNKDEEPKFFSEVKESFKEYCKKLSDLSSSPLLRQYDIFRNTFCFQSDTYYIDENGEKRNIILDVGFSYIFHLLRFASFTIQLAQLYEPYSAKQEETLTNQTFSTFTFITESMQSFYKVDNNGNPYDNYCYLTSCPLAIGNNIMKFDEKNYISVGINSSRVDVDDDGVGYHFGNLTIEEDQTNIVRLNGDQLTYLWIMESKMPLLITPKDNKRPSFDQYLGDVLNGEIKSNLYISSTEATNFAVSDNDHLMNTYVFGQNEKNYVFNNAPEGTPENQLIINDTGYNGQGKLDNDDFIYHQEIGGSYLNTQTGTVVYDDSLYSVAAYYKSNSHIDDLGFFSSVMVGGKDNSDPYIDPNIYGGTAGNTPYKDLASSITVENQSTGDTRWSTYRIDVNYNFQSLNCISGIQYGKVALQNYSPFTKTITGSNLDYICNLTYGLNQIRGLDEYIKMSNNSEYWIGYKTDCSKEEQAAYNDYLINTYLNEKNRDNNLVNLANNYIDFYYFMLRNYSSINDDYFIDIPYTPEEFDRTLDEVLKALDLLKPNGFNSKYYPDETAHGFKFSLTVEPQYGEEFYFDEHGDIKTKYVETYVIKPFLYFESNYFIGHLELPAEISPLIDTKNVEFNIPLRCNDKSKVNAILTLNKNMTNYGVDELIIGSPIKQTDNGISYFTFKAPCACALSLVGYDTCDYHLYTRVDGKEATCSTTGYKGAFKDQDSKYYSLPEVLIGNESDYLIWCSEGGDGFLPITDHTYVLDNSKKFNFNESTEEFTIFLICKDCETETTSVTIAGTFVEDEPASCLSPAKGHYVATYPNNGNAIFVATPYASHTQGDIIDHDLIYVPNIPATCTNDGIIEHYECNICHHYFTDSSCTEEIDDVVIEATHHKNLEKHLPNDATVTRSGNVLYYYCPDCGHYFLDEDCTQKVSYDDVVIPKISYVYIKVPEESPTHYASGHRAYYYCPQNDKCYFDKAGIDEIENFDEWIKEGGEGYLPKIACEFDGPIYYVLNGDQCTASRVCTFPGCKEIKQETVTCTFIIDTPATCTTNAKGHYHASFIDPDFGVYVTPANSTELPNTAIGHNFVDISYTWDNDKCTASGTCIHEGCKKTISLTVTADLIIDTPATCTTNAKGHYEASFLMPGFAKQVTPANSVEVKDSAYGHEYSKIPSYVWNGDKCTAFLVCTHDGCNEVISEVGHTSLVIDSPATCVDNAKGHYEATFLDKRFEDQIGTINSVEVPNSKLGHHFSDPTYTWNGDKCIATMKCTHDGCNEFVSETGFATLVIDTPATEESNAKGHYEVIFGNVNFTKQSTPTNSVDIVGTKLAKKAIGGCAGSITAGSTVLFTLSLAGALLLIFKKRKYSK